MVLKILSVFKKQSRNHKIENQNYSKAIAVDSSPTSPINSTGRSIRIGRRSRSKSPFRSFRWKRNSKLSDEDEDFEGNIFTKKNIFKIFTRHRDNP